MIQFSKNSAWTVSVLLHLTNTRITVLLISWRYKEHWPHSPKDQPF